MHYADIRDRVWAAADYAPAGSPEGIARTREFINRALSRIAMDAPFLFERDINLYLDPDLLPDNSGAVADTWVSTPSFDPWVIRSSWTQATALALYNRFTDPDRPYSGWYFECKDPADSTGERILSFRIREVWTADVGVDRVVFISFFEPTPYDAPGFVALAGGVGAITDWRITMRQYALPPDVIEIQSIRPYDTANDFGEFRYLTAEDAARYGYEGSYWNDTVTSLPWVYWAGTVETLPNMSVAPIINSTLTWSSAPYAEPKGEFEYVYTLSLGERHDEVQDINPLASSAVAANASGRRMPYIESPPSPISTSVSNVASGTQLQVVAPDHPDLVGFGDAATERYNRVGVKANFYRRRLSVDPAHATPYPSSNHFQHIGSVSFYTSAGAATLYDDGTKVPGRRLRRIGGYKTLRFSHAPDRRYRLLVRCVVRPYEMLDDSDACEVPPSAIDALIFLSLRNLYEASGNPSMAASSFMDYERALHALKKRHASLKPSGQTWRMRSRSSKRWKRGYRHHDVIEQS